MTTSEDDAFQMECEMELGVDDGLTEDQAIDDFLKQFCPRVRDLPKLLKRMKKRWPTRQWPQKDASKTTLSFRCIDTLLDILGNGKSVEVLTGYASSRKRGHVHHALVTTDTKYDTLFQRIKDMLESCQDKNQVDPVRNSVRLNLLKLFQGLEGRDSLRWDGTPFSKQSWQKAHEKQMKHGYAC